MNVIHRAIETVGGITNLARAIGVTPPTVHQWKSGERPVPAERCRAIEEATEGAVTRYELRPDVFGPSPDENEQKAA